jgi:gluconokinase
MEISTEAKGGDPSPKKDCMAIVLIGVTGSGKSTVGRSLAAELGWRFIEADDFHPAASVDKMKRGVPLTDSDRMPWLQSVKTAILTLLTGGESAVVACSALKKCYRILLRTNGEIKFVYLKASPSLIEARLKERRNHFMNPALIPSQFDTLEEPKKALWIDAALPLHEAVKRIRNGLRI